MMGKRKRYAAEFKAQVGLKALRADSGGLGRIFNTDHGSQSTSARFVEVVQAAGVRVSMEGRGR